MAEKHLQEQIQAYDAWKSQLIDAINDFESWLDSQNLDEEGENTLRIYEAKEALKKDRLNIAFVAEFSRGKTELINAIFFADYKRRLLPSDAGRTTMCPSELFYDRETNESYIRLLPIETRLEETSIAEYKHDPINWTKIPLNVDSAEQMEEALHAVIETKHVSVKEAGCLGLFNEEMHPHINDGNRDSEEIEIPKWRHALISFPHPLLQQGLVILDTPGLNALGSEPELTMSMLPAAQAVMFILAADTGVTRSDLDVWQYHIDGARLSRQKKGVAVILNKIDAMWDELKSDSGIAASINKQVHKTALMLGVDDKAIYPVSAQKGLLAKIKNDPELLRKSNLQSLENFLCEDILPSRESILRESITGGLGAIIEGKKNILATRLQNIDKQLGELRGLSGKNADVIMHLMKKTREEQITYSKNVEGFNSSRRLMQRQATEMMNALSLNAMDDLINKSRKNMVGSWTTAGLKNGMKTLFEGFRETSEQVQENAENALKLVVAIYNKFHEEHGLPEVNPPMFSIDKFNEHMDLMYEEAELFRKSPVTTMTEQNFVIKKFFISLVSQARNVFFKANQEAENWLKEVMNPLIAQIKEHKDMMEKRLNTLKRINDSRETLDSKINELEAEQSTLNEQINRLDGIREKLFMPIPFESTSSADSKMASA